MIESFQFCTEEGVKLNVKLGVKVTLFEENNRNDITRYFKCKSTGVKWVQGNNEITIFESNHYLNGYPTHDLQKVVIIFPMEHNLYGAPDNAVIYNDDGTVFRQLKTPKLISEIAIKREAFHQSANFSLVHFNNVRWALNNKGDIVTVLTIAFDRDWQEDRVLDIETGEFGECLSSGRR